MTSPSPDTRHVYRDHLLARMASNPRVVCLDSDTGTFAGVDFGDRADRYLNLGIAEHNLMGVAAGLAASGRIPYVNTMAGFAVSRAAEAVKIDIAYNRLPVRIIGTHGGVAGGHFGPTHHALDDLGMMRSLPNMTVVVPGDVAATAALLDQVASCPGPVYVRLGRRPHPPLPAAAAPPRLGRLQSLRDGREVVFVATGPLPVLRSLAAAEMLAAAGVSAAVVQAHTLKPFDAAGLLAWTADARLVVTVEEHWRTGGLGSAVAEVIAETSPRPVLRLGLPDAFVMTVGTQEELLDAAGLSPPAIAHAVGAALSAAPSMTNEGVGHDQLSAV